MRFVLGSLLKALAGLIYYSPKFIQKGLGYFLGILWFDVFRIRREVALENLEIAFPEKTSQERVHIARSSVLEMGRCFVEYINMYFYEKEQVDTYFRFENLGLLESALAHQRGVLILGLHLSNGDFGITGLSSRGYGLHVISKVMTSQWLDRLWFSIRKKHGVEFIAPRKSAFDILKALKKKESVVFVLDQFMGPPLGVETEFFGKKTGTAFGLALFSEKTKAPVLPCFTYRDSEGFLVIRFEEEIPLETKETRDLTLQFMTQKYTDKIEDIIRRYPKQWMWIHRRWKVFG